MDKIGTYGLYQNNYMRNAGAEQAERAAASRTEETKSPSRDQVRLSEGAQSLLKELKSAYGNSDFIIADYETEEEAASLLSRGKSQYSVLLTPEELEKMAADKDAKKDGLKTLEEGFSKLGEMKEQLGEKGRDVTRMSPSVTTAKFPTLRSWKKPTKGNGSGFRKNARKSVRKKRRRRRIPRMRRLGRSRRFSGTDAPEGENSGSPESMSRFLDPPWRNWPGPSTRWIGAGCRRMWFPADTDTISPSDQIRLTQGTGNAVQSRKRPCTVCCQPVFPAAGTAKILYNGMGVIREGKNARRILCHFAQ